MSSILGLDAHNLKKNLVLQNLIMVKLESDIFLTEQQQIHARRSVIIWSAGLTGMMKAICEIIRLHKDCFNTFVINKDKCMQGLLRIVLPKIEFGRRI